MGGGGSKPAGLELGKHQSEVVHLMMPLYYTTELLTDDELIKVKAAWAAILTNSSPEFKRLRKEPSFPHDSCIKYFYSNFYERLFDIHPHSRELFKDVSQQGHFLVKIISLALSEKDDPKKYESTLVRLAEIHNERGVKAVECKPTLPPCPLLHALFRLLPAWSSPKLALTSHGRACMAWEVNGNFE